MTGTTFHQKAPTNHEQRTEPAIHGIKRPLGLLSMQLMCLFLCVTPGAAYREDSDCDYVDDSFTITVAHLEGLLKFRSEITSDPTGCLAGWWKEGEPIPSDQCNRPRCKPGESQLCGVECDELGRIYTINLTGRKLKGKISSSLQSILHYCTFIDLSENELEGSIPDGLGYDLNQLQILSLHHNKLSGPIPPSLLDVGPRNELRLVYLHNNQLTGLLPPTLGNLDNLKYLDLSENNLIGPVLLPPRATLDYISLSSTYLTGDLVVPKDLALKGCKQGTRVGVFLANTCLRTNDSTLLPCYLPYKSDKECSAHGLPPGSASSTAPPPPSPSPSDQTPAAPPPSPSEDHSTPPPSTPSEPPAIAPSSSDESSNPPPASDDQALPPSLPETLAAGPDFSIESEVEAPAPSPAGPAGFECEPNVEDSKGTIRKDQLEILLQLRSSITSDPTGCLAGWWPAGQPVSDTCRRPYCMRGNSAMCGVECDEYGSTVVLDLSLKQLAGILPENFGVGLSSIESLDLSYNFLSGAIPWSLPAATAGTLSKLRLNQNQLTGAIPSSMSTMTLLEILDLSFNQLSGKVILPLNPVLTFVNLQSNFFSGDIALPSFIVSIGCDIENQAGYFLSDTCLRPMAGYDVDCFQPIKKDKECLSFCDSLQELGACGSHGECLLDPETQQRTCKCSEGYKTFDSTNTCLLADEPGRGLTYPALSKTPKSSTFRYASMFYDDDTAKWNAPRSFDWRSTVSWPIQDQGKCAASWAFSSVASIEGAAAMAYGMSTPPKLSEQQVLECSGAGSCKEGDTGAAMDYIVKNALQLSESYAYTGKKGSCGVDASTPPGPILVQSHEKVNFQGWYGLLLAVSQQPVQVAVEASGRDFIQYAGGVFKSASCFSKGVDHSVLIVGYNLNADEKHWIVRNSWGTRWGEGGYMRLLITAGDGICGVNTQPGHYTVLADPARNDPCNKNSVASRWPDSPFQLDQGSANPCGKYQCTARGATSYTCDCQAPFVRATNADGSEACVPKKPCDYFAKNPCGVGTCLNAPGGTYNCSCPAGFAVSQRTSDGSSVCIPALSGSSFSHGLQYFTVPGGSGTSCANIADTYGISKAKLLQLNPGLSCSTPLPKGTKVDVTGGRLCIQPYTISITIRMRDTCKTIEKQYNTGSLVALNPDLDCNKLAIGQKVCIRRGPVLDEVRDSPLCTLLYAPKAGEDCKYLISMYFKGKASAFYALNAGLNCDRLLAPDKILPALDDVCLASTATFGGVTKNCKSKKSAAFEPGQHCLKVYKKYFGSDRTRFLKANENTPCESMLRAGVPKFCLE